jgi:hypothetical protein
MPNLPLLLLISGYVLITATGAYFIRKWIVAPLPKGGLRSTAVRLLNIFALLAASLSAIALTTSYYVGQRFSPAGLPILILIFVLCGSPKRYAS